MAAVLVGLIVLVLVVLLTLTVLVVLLALRELLLTGLLIAGEQKAVAVKGTVIAFIAAICIIVGTYLIYRIISKKK